MEKLYRLSNQKTGLYLGEWKAESDVIDIAGNLEEVSTPPSIEKMAEERYTDMSPSLLNATAKCVTIAKREAFIEGAKAMLPHLSNRDEWVSVEKDGFPKENGWYCVYVEGWVDANMLVAFFVDGDFYDRDGEKEGGWIVTTCTTHWRPLPSPPSVEG